jgi:hypothetical protein
MSSQGQLQIELEKILQSHHVYFQPPESLRMQYPAIRYKLVDYKQLKANNHVYFRVPRYTITVITTDPDSDIATKILDHFPNSSYENKFGSNGLYNETINLFF